MKNQKIKHLLKELKEDNSSGAAEFIDKAIEIIKFQLKQIKVSQVNIKDEIFIISKRIIETRPSMAPLINTIGYILNDLDTVNKEIINERLVKLDIKRRRIKENLELNFHNFLENRTKPLLRIMLISYSSTIFNLLLNNNDHNLELYILESRPLMEGKRVAERLSKHFKTHLIIDAAVGYFINHVDLVLVGIDSVLRDGSIVNKIGTFPLAIIAKSQDIDVFVVGDSFKYNLRSHFGQQILIEEKPIREVYNKQITGKLEIHNYYFDITPPQYFTGIISDLGVLNMKTFLEKVKEKLPIEWFKYFINNKGV
ncbi:MAG: translation initiation factor eIF-2B [Promethearchaeota archaeon]